MLCGATALKSFIKTKTPISKIRGEFFDIEISGKNYQTMPIFHPSYLLRNHSLEPNSPRDLMLKDLKKVKKLLFNFCASVLTDFLSILFKQKEQQIQHAHVCD